MKCQKIVEAHADILKLLFFAQTTFKTPKYIEFDITED